MDEVFPRQDDFTTASKSDGPSFGILWCLAMVSMDMEFTWFVPFDT